MKRVYNFGAGPAMLPLEVMEKAQLEFLDYRGLGAGLIEISHRSAEFDSIINHTDELLTELAGIPANYKILYIHGGAQMQFSAIPLNLINRHQAQKASFVLTGNWAVKASKEATRYGKPQIIASSEKQNFSFIPSINTSDIDPDSSYLHITSNNTLFGTRWQEFPKTGDIPLVADMTSEFLSRRINISDFGLIFAGLQKNLGPAGLALVIIREDLLDYALPQTPALLNYKTCAEQHSLSNTINTFAIYMMSLVLQWLKDKGGVAAMEQLNEAKAALLYDFIDRSDFYRGTAQPAHRSTMNVTFNLNPEHKLAEFLAQAEARGLYALKGHRAVGGARASIYNAMPLEGCQALVDFMAEFAEANT
ncbi:MAG: 3-phosphoserine/phosphohydroxythreonine transaminase [Gammaproteobacteria bacterium]|nr:3-phosphoserine/phosphohydroxythreonine transaminase [Gammaproteobacteria bacterium]MCY4356546.1 3-phosphoserine/phosphohydroxythreonine transaminase [Gammaproteobacteria bacterium]